MKPFDLEAAKAGNPICLNGAWLYALIVIGLALAFWADALSPPLQAERLTAATVADVAAEQSGTSASGLHNPHKPMSAPSRAVDKP